MEKEKTTELKIAEGSKIVSIAEPDKSTRTRRTVFKTLNFNGLVIEVLQPKENISNLTSSQPLSNGINSTFTNRNQETLNVDFTADQIVMTKSASLPSIAVNGTVSLTQQKIATPQLPPKPAHMKSSPIKRVPDEQFLPLISEAPPTEPAFDDLDGAAGLWAQDEEKAKCFAWSTTDDLWELLDDVISQPEAPEMIPEEPITEEPYTILEELTPEVPCYGSLLEMDKTDLVKNTEDFVCSICEEFITFHEGVVLKGCLHTFCVVCLLNAIYNNHDTVGQVRCPLPTRLFSCDNFIGDEEKKELLGGDYSNFCESINEAMDQNLRMEEIEKNVEQHDMIPLLLVADNEVIDNFEEFECAICFAQIEVGEGVILKDCLHNFCKDCLINAVKHSDDLNVKCPYIDADRSCGSTLQEREIRGIVPPDVFEKYLERSIKLYEGASVNAIHCKTPDCRGFIEKENEQLRDFDCPVCRIKNCIACKVIHAGKTCQEYQDELNPNARNTRENAESESAIKVLIETNLAMLCPRCGIPVMKDEGCDSITCTACKLPICWVTKRPRQPLTKADGSIIDGCHCNENGRRCDPMCQNCH